MKRLWDIRLSETARGEYRVRIDYQNGVRIVEGHGSSPHFAYKHAEAQLIFKPWLTSKDEDGNE